MDVNDNVFIFHRFAAAKKFAQVGDVHGGDDRNLWLFTRCNRYLGEVVYCLFFPWLYVVENSSRDKENG